MARLGLIFNELENAERADSIMRQGLRLKRRLDPENDAFYCLSDDEFNKSYRLTKSVTSDLIHELEPMLGRSSIRSTSVSVVAKVLSAVSFYAHGSYQLGIGQCVQHSMSQQTVSNCLREVTAALNTPYMRNKYIKFPQSRVERDALKLGFYRKFKMPGVIGCVDGTHVAIVRPALNEERFLNRKGYHSLNTQIVCDSDLNIMSVDASHGGSNHDSYIWEQHRLRPHMEQLQQTERSWLLGDSGYAQRRWMMTPFQDPQPNTPAECYNECQIRTRNVVERAIGVLKARWRCLLVHRVLHYSPQAAGSIVNACVILHNIANAARLPVQNLTEEESQAERDWQMAEVIHNAAGDRQAPSRNRLLAEGRAAREVLASRITHERQ